MTQNICGQCDRLTRDNEGFYACEFEEGVLRGDPACEHFLPRPVEPTCDLHGKRCLTCSGCDTEAELAREHEQEQESWD